MCKIVEHLESFAASPTFPQRSLNRENDMFSHQGCSCYILIAKLTPEQYLVFFSRLKGKHFMFLHQWHS